MRSTSVFATCAALLLITAAFSCQLKAADCEGLSALKLPNTEISVAESVPAGSFAPPYGYALEKLPAFCRVAGVIKPSSDSYIRFEVWLPASGWNEKYLGVGNGGFAGSIDYRAMGGNLKRGYATAATDTGHEADAVDASWAYKHPEKVSDFGYRALHETTGNAKRLMQAFYSHPPRHSYFDSCSDGGREALMEAQRFPEDFDGILAGAPANLWTHMLASGVDLIRQMYGQPDAYLSTVKLPAVTAAALAACDAQDGLKDGIISDPAHCKFDPGVLLCKGVETRNCLTAPQLASLRKIYTGGKSSSGQQLFPGFVPGVEDQGWNEWLIGPGPGGSAAVVYAENYFRYMVFQDPTWNPLTARLDIAERAADEKTEHALNATDPDLHRFQARGGKLVLYHGWNDPAISPFNTINYYNSVRDKLGVQNADKFVRLYMVAGVEHCIGGPGPSSFGQLGTVTAKGPEHGIYDAREAWVENDTSPAEIVGTRYFANDRSKGVQMTRPLCPYPQLAKYKGSGDTNDSANWSCEAQGR